MTIVFPPANPFSCRERENALVLRKELMQKARIAKQKGNLVRMVTLMRDALRIHYNQLYHHAAPWVGARYEERHATLKKIEVWAGKQREIFTKLCKEQGTYRGREYAMFEPGDLLSSHSVERRFGTSGVKEDDISRPFIVLAVFEKARVLRHETIEEPQILCAWNGGGEWKITKRYVGKKKFRLIRALTCEEMLTHDSPHVRALGKQRLGEEEASDASPTIENVRQIAKDIC